MTAMNPGGPRGRLIDGRFELLERLGGGGMGLVWRARDTALDREVALKEVRPPDLAEEAADPEGARLMRERVLREARALARLQHPNVATIHHIVDTPEHPYPWLVMELVTGGSLADRLNRGPLSVAEAARVGRGVLSALRAAHAAGIQHRDVKPGNVLLRAVGGAGGPDVGVPVLTDFGIAAVQNSTALTATGALIGSPEYIAPERIRGVEGDPSSDLWSLGMLLYVAVEGHHPLRRATALATLAAVLDEPLPPPERSGALGPLLSALLAKDPATRPDADGIDRALAAAEYAAGGAGPVAPPRPAPPYYGDSSSTGTANLVDGAPPYPAPSGTPQTGTPYPPPAGTPQTGTPYPAPPPPYHGGGQPQGHGPQVTGPHGYVSQMETPPGHIPSAYGPPSYGTPPQGMPTDRRPAPGNGNARHKSGRVALAVVSSTTTIALVGFGVWQLLPGKGDNATHAGGVTPSVSSTGPGPLASRGTPSASPATGGSGTAPAPPGSLLTPAGVRAVVKAMAPYMLGSKVIEFTVYDDHATAEVQTRADPKNLDDLSYRDGVVTHEPDEALDPDDTLVDLDDYDWDVIPKLLTKAQQTLKVPHPTLRYIIVEPDLFDESPVFAVYLTDDYDGGYLEATPQGKVKEINPKGS